MAAAKSITEKEREVVYLECLHFVRKLDEKIVTGRVHLKGADGRLMYSLDEVVRFLLSKDSPDTP